MLICLFAAHGLAATYYVDATGGDDTAAGTDAGAAWKTLTKVNGSQLAPGDSVLLKRGETWRDTLVISSSGSTESPITFGAYGHGDDPVITGADAVSASAWTEGAGAKTSWQAALASEPTQVYFDGVRGARVAGADLVTVDKTWSWTHKVLTVHSAGNPGTSYKGIEVVMRDHCIAAVGQSYVTIEGLACRYAKKDAVSLTAKGSRLAGLTVRKVAVSGAFRRGINVSGTSSYPLKGVRILENILTDIGGETSTVTYAVAVYHAEAAEVSKNAITLSDLPNNGGACGAIRLHMGGAREDTGSRIHRNTVDGKLQHGKVLGFALSIDDVSYIDIYGNVFTADVDNIVMFDETSPDKYDGPAHCVFHANRIQAGPGAKVGLLVERSEHNSFRYNVFDFSRAVAANHVAAFWRNSRNNAFCNNTLIYKDDVQAVVLGRIEDPAGDDQRGCRIKNNIFSHSGNAVGSMITVVDGNKGSPVTEGIEFDHNLYSDSDWNAIVNWYGTYYASVGAWKSERGQEAHHLAGDPLFVNAAGGDFRLRGASPAVDAGVELGKPHHLGLHPATTWPDGIMTMDQNAHGVRWEIGAYVFPSRNQAKP